MSTSLFLGAYKKLKKQLGKFDSYADLTLLALRDFNERALGSSEGIGDFIQERADHFGLRVHFNQLPMVEGYMSKYFIVMVFGSFERFFDDFYEDLMSHGLSAKWVKDAKLSDKLEAIRTEYIATLKGRDLDEWMVRHNLVMYYRLIRNYAAHGSDPKQIVGELRTCYGKIEPPNTIVQKLYSQSGLPKDENSLIYDDFRFCSQVVKDYAFGISALTTSTRDLKQYFEGLQKTFGRYQTKGERMRNAILGRIKHDLQIDNSDAQKLYDLAMGC